MVVMSCSSGWQKDDDIVGVQPYARGRMPRGEPLEQTSLNCSLNERVEDIMTRVKVIGERGFPCRRPHECIMGGPGTPLMSTRMEPMRGEWRSTPSIVVRSQDAATSLTRMAKRLSRMLWRCQA